MPQAPAGEAELRDLAERYARAEGQILGHLTAATDGGRREAMAAALLLITRLRLLDHRAPIVAAYMAINENGRPDAVADLARSLHRRLDSGAQVTADGIRRTFPMVTADNLDEMASAAVCAAVDGRGTRWSLGRWAEMNTATIGRQATSRGVADRAGEGGHVTVNVGDCEWCQSHAGDAVIGQDPLPPFHPNCSCVASR
jgi:hypothetical protein